MRKNFKLGAIVLIVFFAAGWICWGLTKKNIISVINNADKLITYIQITVCNKEYRIEKIYPGSEKLIEFSITGDSGFLVKGEFEDGRKISGVFGYVTKDYKADNIKIIVDSAGFIKGECNAPH